MAKHTTYSFGDSPLAARRLGLLAAALDPSTRRLLAETQGPERPDLAVDLGCGPGHSTALTAAVTGAARTVGLDSSQLFLARARVRYPHLEFRRHDVTQPLPTGPATLIFARFVLAHLPDPPAWARAWSRDLVPGGRLVLQEVDAIDVSQPVLADYETLVLGVVEDRGAPMYAGPSLAALEDDDVARWVTRRRTVSVPSRAAARIYRLNLEVWRHDPAVATRADADAVDSVATRLDELARDGRGRVVWRLREVAGERRR